MPSHHLTGRSVPSHFLTGLSVSPIRQFVMQFRLNTHFLFLCILAASSCSSRSILQNRTQGGAHNSNLLVASPETTFGLPSIMAMPPNPSLWNFSVPELPELPLNSCRSLRKDLVKSVWLIYPNVPSQRKGLFLYQADTSSDAQYRVELFFDGGHHLGKSSSADCRIAVLSEPPTISPGQYKRFEDPDVYSHYHSVFTYSRKLMALDSRFKRHDKRDHVLAVSKEFRKALSDDPVLAEAYLRKVFGRERNGVSIILSNKKSAPGHRMRHAVWHRLREAGLASVVSGCGRGSGGAHVPDKSVCLDGFYFTIVIENDKDQDWYISEKVHDAIVAGAIPIVWGSGEFISKIFDARGMIFFNTVDEVVETLKHLNTPQKQRSEAESRMQYAIWNYWRLLLPRACHGWENVGNDTFVYAEVCPAQK